tara:strand:+ start:1210 stop:2352 length:1143 start_codon:yes stop_codon:yes gene_type:complete
MNLTNESIESTYGNLLTIGSTAGTPTQGTLQNGAGQDITKIVVDEIEANKIIQTQTTVAANGTTLSSGTILGAGVSLVTSSSSSNIAVKLPAPQLGLIISIVNTSTRDIYVFPNSSSSSIGNLPLGDYYTIPADNQLYQFLCVQNPTVGNWSVTTPSQNTGVTKTYTLNMVADGTYGVGISRSTQSNFNPQLSGPFGVSPNQKYYLQRPGANVDWIDTPEFDTFTQHRIIARTVTSNIPAGDLTANVSQLASTLMGINASQFFTCQGFLKQGYQLLTPTNGSSLSSNDATLATFRDDYSLAVANGLSTGAVSHYMRGTTLCQQNIISLPNSSWIDNKMNGVRRYYYAPRIQYGDGSSNPATGFPSGFSFECEMSLTFEFR